MKIPAPGIQQSSWLIPSTLNLILALTSGCTSLEKIGGPTTQPIGPSTKDSLAGRFNNKIDDYQPALWGIVAPMVGYTRKHQSREKVVWDSLKVDIDPIADNKLNIKLYDDYGLVRSKVVKGKYKDGYFYARRKMFAVPLFPIWGGWNFGRYRLGLTDNNLSVDFKRNEFQLFFIIHVLVDNQKKRLIYCRRELGT